MSQKNVELVKALFPTGFDLVEFFSEDAVAALMEFGPPDSFADNFVVRFISDTPGAKLEYRGVEGLLEGWRDWLEPWASYHAEVESFLDAGDEVVVLIRVRAKTARDGVEMEHSPASVWTISAGKVVSIRMFLNRDTALMTAGLVS
jgi:ketosteroid isomerase-like protein